VKKIKTINIQQVLSSEKALKLPVINIYFILAFFVLLLSGCASDYNPKPKGFNRIVLPEHEYRVLPDTFPYQFEYSKHANLKKDTSWLAERHWMQLYYPQFDASIELTYKPVFNSDSLLFHYFETSYRLTSQHKQKAYSIEETGLVIPNGDRAIIAELTGEVPSQMQFYTSDSTMNFLRGALYFKTATQNDSLRPVIDYIKKDMLHMLMTLQWDKDFPVDKLK
jgi:gliding motility-associated lipoprotein GldD